MVPPFLIAIKPKKEELCQFLTKVKPLQVALVKPVVYQFELTAYPLYSRDISWYVNTHERDLSPDASRIA